MNFITFSATFLFALTSAFGNSKNNKKVQELCNAGKFKEVAALDAKKVTYKGLKPCLKNHDISKDTDLAAIIESFPKALPTGQKFEKKVGKFYECNMDRSLRAMLRDGRCQKLSKKMRDFLISKGFEDVCKKGHYQAAIPGGAGKKDIKKTEFSKKSASKSYKSGTPVGPAIEGSLSSVDEYMVRDNVDILARITTKQASELGHCNNACLGFTKAHFEAPGVVPEVVANLSIHCFRRIPAEAFAGLNKQTVGIITAWPFARRAQIHNISPKAIVALPFDQLGVGKQTKANEKKHACFGVTAEQLKAIKKNSKAAKLYKSRCHRNTAGNKLAPNAVALTAALSFILLTVL